VKRFVADGVTYKLSVGLVNKKHKLLLTRTVGGSDRYVLFAKSVDKGKLLNSFVETMNDKCPDFNIDELVVYLTETLEEQS
jgi:hypothetical protein